MKILKHDVGHMTKIAAMPIYVRNSSTIFFSGTNGQISMNFGMEHWGPGPIIICSNDDLS